MRFLDIPIGQPAFFDPQSAWLRHGPFAMWLVGALRPARIVELGTHNGYSYFAFCQAVQEHGLTAECVAVDTWQGDEHAGFYGDEVHASVVHHNAPYAGFSTLLRKTFDAALEDVDDGSIDLLHVDGRHFYDDVKEDFESWMPKLSPRAVVLFHDTEVRERGFGVWKYWAEIAGSRPSLNFPHQHGLGVLFWGSETQGDIARLIALLDHDGGREAVTDLFVLAGENSVRDQVYGDLPETPPERVLPIRAEYEALLSRVHAEKGLLAEQIGALKQSLGRAQEATARQRRWTAHLDAMLRQARSRPWALVGSLGAYRVLDALSRATPPLPGRTAQRFARSARKRNPRLSPMLLADSPWAAASGLAETPEKPALSDIRDQVRVLSQAGLDDFLNSAEEIVLPLCDAPRVTVILVLWNQAPLTLACLRSLADEVSVPLEVIIVDNASSDRTPELLRRVKNARVLRQGDNIGFLRAVNLALTEVRGGHVLLLNNDATLRPDTLSAAVEAMDSDPDVGAVGGPIVLPNGALQEAGSIIWNDGSCLGYGRDDDPGRGPYMFRREVDYCSGAFLLIRDGLFQSLGGFDEAYAPAYYEETDLCMRLRAAGYRVIYEPLAVIDHFEFGSSGKVSTALELQRRNRETFCRKHAQQLRDHLPADPGNVLAARMRDDRPRILFIEDRVPLPNAGAGLPRANEILRLMAGAGYFVTFFPATTPTEDWSETFATVPHGVEVAMGHGLPGLEAFLEARTGYYRQIFISRPHNMSRLKEIADRRPQLLEGVRVIYDAEAIFASRDLSQAELLDDDALRRKAAARERAELALAGLAHHVTAVSTPEAERFRSLGGPTVSVLGHALPAMPTPAGFAERRHVLFLGSLVHEDSPNVDSLVWFVDHVLPRLGQVFQGPTRFLVAGRNDVMAARARRSERVDLLGAVEDLGPLFDQARVFVAPTRYAAGIPHKVHQAAALGVPVVATSLLARQLGWVDGRHLLVADGAEDFARAVGRLFHDQPLWESLRHAALAQVGADCSPETFRAELLQVLGPEPAPGMGRKVGT